jgi:D-alanyl-D-alanine dipeptidase
MDLKKLIPDLLVSMPYATTNNFTKVNLYKNSFACLRQEPALALKKIQEELNKKDLALKLYDAFRPFSITCKMWRLVPDRHYAANPRNGSNHNRGVAVDLTIIDLKTGKELNMGTLFDNFTDSAHHDFYNLPPEVIANRRLLKTIMRKYGFNIVPTEWWHYQWVNRAGYEIIDLDFDDIKSVLQ